MEYELPPHRYRELKHFCLQYDSWKRLYFEKEGANVEPGDVTGRVASRKADYMNAIQLIETTAYDTSKEWGQYILSSVVSDEICECSCDPVEFKRLIRKFYWLLSVRKGV